MKRVIFLTMLTVCGFSRTVRADAVLDWNEVLLGIIRASALPAPQATRVMAMVHVAIHDAVNAIDRTHEAYAIHATAPSDTSQEAAAAQAAYRVLTHLFPTQQSLLDAQLTRNLTPFPPGPEKDAGVALGNAVGIRIVALRQYDGSKTHRSYTLRVQPGTWQPTPQEQRPALLPLWAEVTPFALTHTAQFRSSGPPSLKSPEYATAFNEVKALGAATSVSRTTEQTAIAKFWADGSGTGLLPLQWNRIARAVARARGNSAPENARLFALLNIALADAAIVAWDMEYIYNLWRPITAIQRAAHDGNPATDTNPAWRPLLVSPPMPSYPDTHSLFSSAAAEVLQLFFGADDLKFLLPSTDGTSHRAFHGLSLAAEEAGRSGIYAGIHFEFDHQAGLVAGRALGRFIYDNCLQPLAAPDVILTPPTLLLWRINDMQSVFRPLTDERM
jgi:hypothetical protein